jgi:hypothetical protein
MLFPQDTYKKLADGSVTLAFRRWKRPNVRVGTRQRTHVGVIEVTSVDAIEPDAITDSEARLAGATDRLEVLRELERREGTLYRIGLRFAGADPRVALRERDHLSEDERTHVLARLARLDRASRSGSWTRDVLRLIEQRPAARAADLAASIGRDRDSFKLDVRKLKELGLTESLPVGYRLSPRGRAVLRDIELAALRER